MDKMKQTMSDVFLRHTRSMIIKAWQIIILTAFFKHMKIIILGAFLFVSTPFIHAQAWCQITKINDSGSEDLGRSVAIDGDYAVAGAPGYNDDLGCAYVMKYNSTDTTWQKVARLTASDGAQDDKFGLSVDISGDYVVVGAMHDDENGSYSGSAYVFTKPAGGWTDMDETAKLKAQGGGEFDQFGKSVAIEGDIISIGAPGHNQSESYPGYVYLFKKPSTGWESVSSDKSVTAGPAGGYFGSFVSISNGTMAIGAPKADAKGAAYIFTESGDEWIYTAKLSPTHNQTIPALGFGGYLDIQGDVIVVGGPGYGTFIGRAYVFEKPAGGWSDMTQTAVLSASDKADFDMFGSSLSIYNDTIVVGTKRKVEKDGSVYFYKKPASGWVNATETDKIAISQADGEFGFPVDLGNNGLIVGYEAHFYKYTSFNPITITTQPTVKQVACVDAATGFSFSGNSIRTYQWQVSNDNGASFLNLSDNTTYSGTHTSSISINVNESMDGFQYRCIVSNPQYSDTTDNGLLVIDDIAPAISQLPLDKTLFADTTCEAILPDYTGNVTASDNCSAVTITQTPEMGTVISGENNQVTLTISDERGNETEAGFNVAVIDTIKPVWADPAENYILEANDSCVGIIPDFGTLLDVGDNCDDTLDVDQSLAPGTVVDDSIAVSIDFADDAGNILNINIKVKVADMEPPTILSSHENVIIKGDGQCMAILPSYKEDVEAMDNCDTLLIIGQQPEQGTPVSGADNMVTLLVTDNSGNTSEVKFNVAVDDTVPPSITCKSDTFVDLLPGDTSYTVQGNEFDLLLANDNCGATSISNDYNNSSTLKGAVFNPGSETIQWTVVDGIGNPSSCSMNITVKNPLGINKSTPGEIVLFPNPTSGKLYCKFGNIKVSRVKIMDITGQVISTKAHVDAEPIDLYKLPNGMYFIGIHPADAIYTSKIIKHYMKFARRFCINI